jgi:hypothetical protein
MIYENILIYLFGKYLKLAALKYYTEFILYYASDKIILQPTAMIKSCGR